MGGGRCGPQVRMRSHIMCMNCDLCRFRLESIVCLFVVAVRDEAAVRAALATDHACLKAWMALGVGGESVCTVEICCFLGQRKKLKQSFVWTFCERLHTLT